MKRIYSIIAALIIGINSVTYASIFPGVDKPDSPDASLIALKLDVDERGELTVFLNANWSVIVPLVKKEDGTFVDFRMVTGKYYKENLKAGKYTLVGFRHVYTDFGKLEEYKKANGIKDDDLYFVKKDAFDNMPYHIKQDFLFDEPIEFTLKPNAMMSLGEYVLKYRKGNGGAKGTSDDRYKITKYELMMSDPDDDSILHEMKQWSTKKWKMWNEKNPVK
jgi:hypothetical protein